MAAAGVPGPGSGSGRPERVDRVDVLWELQIALEAAAKDLEWVLANDLSAEAGYQADAEALETAIEMARELSGKHRAVFRGVLARLRVHIARDEADDEVKRVRLEQIRERDLPRLRRMCRRLEGIEEGKADSG